MIFQLVNKVAGRMDHIVVAAPMACTSANMFPSPAGWLSG
jgi:hypothetical protein